MSPKDYSFAFWTLTFLLLFYSTFAHASIVHDVDCAAKPSVQTYESPIRMKFGAEPRGRGTWGILISCTATFAFCVWTTVHPNILPDASVQYRTLYKAVMMVIGVINPEGLMILSYGQWADARRLNQEVQKYWNEKHKDIKHMDQPPIKKGYEQSHWDWLGMDGAFFVVMGGFVIDTSKESYDTDTRPEPFRDVDFIKFKPRQKSKFNATLTPTGFVKYLHDGYFDFHNPPFKKREIIDKGKASNIAKLLSAVQAFWLAVQCAGRRAAGLKLCLLEIHILIQVACTALIFWFWWHKPLDVNEPIYLDLKDAEGNTIKPIQDIENTRFETSTGEPSPTEESPQLTLEGSTTGLQSPGHIGGSASGDVSTRISGNSATDANSSAESPTTTVGSPSNRIFPEHLSISTETSHNQMGDHLNVPDLNSNAMSDTYSISEQGTLNEKLPFLKNEILKRLLKEEHVRLGDALIPDHEAVRPSMELQQHIHPWRRLYTITRTPSGRIGVSDRALHDILFYVTGGTIDDTTLDFSNEEQKARRGHMRRISRMFLENMFIGALAGLHALAWNAEFPTPLERYLWRFSCVGMFVFPIPAVAVAAVRDYHMDIAKIFWNNHTVARYNCWQWVVHAILCIRSLAEVNSRVGTTDQIKKGKLICHYIFLIVAILLLGCYLFCISYITWESYSSMRYPPETTFTTPVWTDYWPKLG